METEMEVVMQQQGRESEKVERIFVGGLGERVSEDDLQRLFSGVGGSVDGVDVIRTKGRSFAYVDFRPSSDKSISKLYTTYNGCVWKGGKLKLHKAKEHYLVRMKREWALQQEQKQKQEEDKRVAASAAPVNHQQAQLAASKNSTKQIRIYFPALRTVKSLPLSGTGKHKYSFQHIQVPTLPLHFCDCEEHYVSPQASHHQVVNHVVKDKELSIMNKVMGKFLGNKAPQNVSGQTTATVMPLPNQSEQHDGLPLATPVEDKQVEAEDEVEDEDDDLIINLVSRKTEKNLLAEYQEFISSGTQSQAQPKSTGPPNKRRKSLLNQNDNETSGGKTNPKTHSKDLGAQSELDVQQSTVPVSWSQKSSWKQLVSQKDNNGFSVSHILTGGASSTNHAEPKFGSSDSDHSDSGSSDSGHSDSGSSDSGCSNSGSSDAYSSDSDMEPTKGSAEHKPTKSVSTQLTNQNTGSSTEQTQINSCVEVPHAVGKDDLAREPQPVNSLSNSNKSRGASWRQKSSWTQMISDNTANTFSISQILPAGITYKQQVTQNPTGADVMCSSSSKLEETVRQDNKFTTGESSSLGIRKQGNIFSSHTTEVNRKNVAVKDSAPKVVGKKCGSPRKQASAGTVDKGEPRLFVRSAASLEEWAKAKAALSGSRKRKTTMD